MSLHYLVKGGCSKFLPNTGIVTIRLLRSGVKVKRAYCRGNFLAQRPLPDMRALSGDEFFLCFNKTAPRRISTQHCRFSGAMEMRETRRRQALVSVNAGHISSTNSDNFEPICHDN